MFKTYRPEAIQRPVIPVGGIGGSAIGPQSPVSIRSSARSPTPILNISPKVLAALAKIKGIQVYEGDPETGEFRPIGNGCECPGCGRSDTIQVGTSKYPRRCPVCGDTVQEACRRDDDIEERSL